MPGIGQERAWGQGPRGGAPSERRAARRAEMKAPDRGSPGSITKRLPFSLKIGEKGPRGIEGSLAEIALVLPEEFVEDIRRSQQVRALGQRTAEGILARLKTPGRQSAADAHAQSLEHVDACFEDPFDSVDAVDGQRHLAKLRTRYPEGDRHGQRARAYVGYDRVVGEAKIGVGQERDEPKGVPGEEVAQVGREGGRGAQVIGRARLAVRGELFPQLADIALAERRGVWTGGGRLR